MQLSRRPTNDDEPHSGTVQRCNQRGGVSLFRVRHVGTFVARGGSCLRPGVARAAFERATTG